MTGSSDEPDLAVVDQPQTDGRRPDFPNGVVEDRLGHVLGGQGLGRGLGEGQEGDLAQPANIEGSAAPVNGPGSALVMSAQFPTQGLAELGRLRSDGS
jgi:hypothetical protein